MDGSGREMGLTPVAYKMHSLAAVTNCARLLSNPRTKYTDPLTQFASLKDLKTHPTALVFK